MGKGDPLGIVQEIDIWPFEWMVHAQTRTCFEEWDAQSSLEFWEIKKSSDPSQKIKPNDY